MALYRSEPRSPDTRITRFKMQQITDSLIMTSVLTLRDDFTVLILLDDLDLSEEFLRRSQSVSAVKPTFSLICY